MCCAKDLEDRETQDAINRYLLRVQMQKRQRMSTEKNNESAKNPVEPEEKIE
jgi:hypothetical protein